MESSSAPGRRRASTASWTGSSVTASKASAARRLPPPSAAAHAPAWETRATVGSEEGANLGRTAAVARRSGEERDGRRRPAGAERDGRRRLVRAERAVWNSTVATGGVIFVYDLSQRKTKTNLNKWAVEVAESGTFSAPFGSGGPGGLPVPYLVIANKVDIAPRDGRRVSSGNLVDVARQWVEKQGLLPSSEELPLADSFPGNSGLLTAAKEARYDKEALIKFFRMLIRRRYFSNELPAPSPWSLTPREDTILPVETVNDDDMFQRKSYGGQSYKYNGVAPLPAQRNLTPPPTLYPQQPMSSSSENYRYHRFSSSSIPDSSGGRTSRANLNI
ncbi:unnamed protein product [Miscanthus lutarioriparius]|uniref:GTP-binding protein n=1 Tax=Miscanthus lutarioriparius TaxID=422564 RepID=A0A811MR48_9POAL|nr:unnamed protein product [Miscanthus lutarioriparius]